MKLSLTMAVAALLVASLEAQPLKGSRAAIRKPTNGRTRGLKSSEGNAQSSTGYWNNQGLDDWDASTATLGEVTVTSNNNNPPASSSGTTSGGPTALEATVTTNNNNPPASSSSGATSGGATALEATVTTSNNNNPPASSSGTTSGGTTAGGYNVGANNGQAGDASVSYVAVTKPDGTVIYQSGTQVVEPSVGELNTYNTNSKKGKSAKGRTRRANRLVRGAPDMTQAYLGPVTVNGENVDVP